MNENTAGLLGFLGAFLLIGFIAFQIRTCNETSDRVKPHAIQACKSTCGVNGVREASGMHCVCD